MRPSCTKCCRKHLSQALVISHELAWYAGDEKDDHFWDLVGHLAEAGDQIQKDSQYLADQIRNQRIMLMNEGADAVRKLDIHFLIRMVSEFDAAAEHPVLGALLPESDPLEDLQKITKSDLSS